MAKVRIGVIGVGGMGYAHCKSAASLEETELTCVCDVSEDIAKERGEEFGIDNFNDYKKLVGSGLCDAVIVATPHWSHSEIAVYAIKKGLDVLSEKPIAVTVSGADKMVEAAKKNKKVFAVMHQRRTTPIIRKAIEIVDSGALGSIQRTLFVDSWYRAQAYYNSGAWRATWIGEGGGVLINQAPHGIDVFTRLGGLPKKVDAKTRTRLHEIEVEDEAAAFLEYENGAWGYYYTTTCEAGGISYLEVAGDEGKLVLRGEDLALWKFSQSLSEFTFGAEGMWSQLEVNEEEIELPADVETGHSAIIKNFANAITSGEPLLAPGEDGLNSVEFINAVIMSGMTGKPVELPVDRKKYNSFMEKLKKSSKPKKVVQQQRVTDPNIAKSK